MAMTVREVDPTDDDAWLRHWAVYNAVARELDGPSANQADPDETRDWVQQSTMPRRYLSAVVDGEVVGCCGLVVRTRNDPVVGYVGLQVLAAARGRRVGTALAEAAEALVREHGAARTEASVLAGRGDGGASEAGNRFAAARGYRAFREDVVQELELPGPVDAGVSPGYRLELVRVVTGHEDAIAVLKTAMSAMAPAGEVAPSLRTWTAADVRHEYPPEENESRWFALALTADGSPAGCTVMTSSPSQPDLLHQGDTIVLPPHRGHGLGFALKAACLARAHADNPGLRRSRTTNAATNGPMLAVNTALGYRPVARITNWVREPA